MSLPTRPTEDAEWASGGSAAILDPAASKKALGWIAEKPPHQYFNWLANIIWKWQIYFDRRTMYTEYVTAAGAYSPDLSRSRRVHFNATAGNQSFVIPTATAPADNDLAFEVKRVDASANTVTIVGTIEGETNPTIDYQFTGRGFYFHGGFWFWSK